MTDTRAQPLRDALKAVTDRVPLITRGVVNAGKTTKPIGWRQGEMGMAISQTRALLDELMLHQAQMGWPGRCRECGSTTDRHSPECGQSWSPDYTPAKASP